MELKKDQIKCDVVFQIVCIQCETHVNIVFAMRNRLYIFFTDKLLKSSAAVVELLGCGTSFAK